MRGWGARDCAVITVLLLVACGGQSTRVAPPAITPADPQAVASLFEALWAERTARGAEAIAEHAGTEALVSALSQTAEDDRRRGAYASLDELGRVLRDDRVVGGPGLAVVVGTDGRVVSRNQDRNRMFNSRWEGPLVSEALGGAAGTTVLGMDGRGNDLSDDWERVGTAAAAPVRDAEGQVIGALFAAWSIDSVERWSERVRHDVLLLHGDHRTTNLDPLLGEQAASAAIGEGSGSAAIEVELAGRMRAGATGRVGEVRWVLLRHLGVTVEPSEPAPVIAGEPGATSAPRSREWRAENDDDGLSTDRDGPNPIDGVDAGDENLLGLIALDGVWHVALRGEMRPADDGDDEAAYYEPTPALTLRPLRDGALAEPVITMEGTFEDSVLLQGVRPWILSGGRSGDGISAQELTVGSRTRSLFTPRSEHRVVTSAFHVGRRGPEGIVLTTHAVFPGAERPRQIERVDERGRREYLSTGPRPTHEELWGTWVGRRQRAQRLLRAELPGQRIEGRVVAASENGTAVAWWVREQDERTSRMTVVRFDPRGRERWRREVRFPGRGPGDPRATLMQDGSTVIVARPGSDQRLMIYGFAIDGTPWPERALPTAHPASAWLLECGSTLSMVTLDVWASGASMRVARRALPPTGAIPDATALYSLEVTGMLEDMDDEELPPGYEPPDVGPTGAYPACSGDRAAVAFDSPFDHTLSYGAPRGLVVVEWSP